MDFVKELQDLRYLEWADVKMSPGTPGCFLKAYEEKNGERFYYKMSNYDSYRGVFGHECVNELIASRLLDILKAEHLWYQLIHAKIHIDGDEIDTYINKTANFRKENERKQPFEVFYELHRKKSEKPLDFAVRMGWGDYFSQMMAIDYLICNRDRHGANIEILVDENENARPAPLFDHGVSLLFSCYNDIELIRKFDVMEDRAVQSFIGSKSLEYNLRFVSKEKKVFNGILKETDKEKLLGDLECVLPQEHLDKIWEMIWGRWERYVQVCNQKQDIQ